MDGKRRHEPSTNSQYVRLEASYLRSAFLLLCTAAPVRRVNQVTRGSRASDGAHLRRRYRVSRFLQEVTPPCHEARWNVLQRYRVIGTVIDTVIDNRSDRYRGERVVILFPTRMLKEISI